MDATKPVRRLFHAGKITKQRQPRPCAHGCAGPFIRRADQDEWLTRLMAEAGFPNADVPPQYDCATCGTTRGFTPRELKGAA